MVSALVSVQRAEIAMLHVFSCAHIIVKYFLQDTSFEFRPIYGRKMFSSWICLTLFYSSMWWKKKKINVFFLSFNYIYINYTTIFLHP